MKHTTFKRIVSMLMICMMLVGTLAGFSVSADATDPTVEIVSNNVKYTETLNLMYAVKAENLPEGATVKVTIFDAEGNTYETLADGTVTIGGVECYKFISKYGVPAQNIDAVLTATAEIVGTSATDTQEYSVLQYLYERLYVSENVTDAQRTLYNALLTYAKKADVLLSDPKETVSSIDNFAYVLLNGEGSMYSINDEIALTHDLPVGENQETVWYANGEELSDEVVAAGVYTVTAAGFVNLEAKVVDVEVEEPAEPVTTTYTFANYAAGTQYAENEVHVLDENVTVTTTQAHFTTQLRLYSSATNNGYAIIQSTKAITAFGMNAGNKKDTVNVYGSTDGSTWELIGGIATTTTSYKDYTLDFGGKEYTYLKLDVEGSNQVRLASITLTTQG